MRGVVLGAMQSLQQHRLIEAIPKKFERDAPRIKRLLLQRAGGDCEELQAENLIEWVEVREGDDFMLSVTAERSRVGLEKPRTTTMADQERDDFGMRVW
jgi:hypothetical protein